MTRLRTLVPMPCLVALLLGSWVLWLWASPAMAGDESPLKPIDTSSPRTTLQGFLEFMNEGYEMGYGMVRSYLASSKLYLSPADIAAMHAAIYRLESAERTLDLSDLPPATARESSRRLAIQLKDILDRIDLPPTQAIPDAAAMATAEFKRWTIPGSDIRIARVETGPRAGEYLFTSETVSRLSEFYRKVEDLAYKPGAAVGFYEFTAYSPAGVALLLHRVVPPRWLLDPPQWARARFLDQPVWRWLAIVAVLAAGVAFVLACNRLRRYWSGRAPAAGRWVALLQPLSVVVVAPLAALILGEVLRVSGVVYQAATLSLWTLFFLALTWTVWGIGTAVAETVIRSERLRAGSIDSQLIRLVLRLLTIMVAIAILVAGADRVGLPAYSVIAGLGVGGLAVALAGQQTLGNLLGSLIIMFEKPFAIGDWIKVSGMEGRVEDVGFRSTRIRTFYDSLITIPSSQLVNNSIDNLEAREHREVKTVLNITYDTPVEEIEGFIDRIKQILEAHPGIRRDNIQVVFHDFGPHSLDILVKFLLRAPNRLAELAERQRILLEILRLAEAEGVRFAFPTKTLHIESVPAGWVQSVGKSPATPAPSTSR